MSRYTDLLPALAYDQYQALRDDIAERGCLVPIELDENGEVLDGAHRLQACQELGIKPPTITRRGLSEEEKAAHAIALNIQRRHLDRRQRTELHQHLRRAGKSVREIAEASGASVGTVHADTRQVFNSEHVGEVEGRDGKTYPATRETTRRSESVTVETEPPKPAPVIDIEGAVTKRQHDQAVHFSSETDEWATPQPLFDALNREFNFDLDVCALPSSAKCEQYFSPEDDGLSQIWSGVCWMNPPYGGEISDWMDKAKASAAAGATVVCLVPARTDTAWWWRTARHGEIRFLKGRLKFGDATSGAPFPSAVVVFDTDVPASVVWWEPRLEVFDVAA